MKLGILLVTVVLLLQNTMQAQQRQTAPPKGSLFIIGGGERSPGLMKKLVSTAKLGPKDYIAVLPMSSESPDTSFFYIQQDLALACTNTVANLNFTTNNTNDKSRLDSLMGAKLIFITGGDQGRFMQVVSGTPVIECIQQAYVKGATIAGTSAGAAVMSKEMITGNEIAGKPSVPASFKRVEHSKVQVMQGLGLVSTAIIDQHFLARSRYNRLLSVLADFPERICIGIDEGTAIIIKNKQVQVAGTGQVVKLHLRDPKNKGNHKAGLVQLLNIHMDILTDGARFVIK